MSGDTVKRLHLKYRFFDLRPNHRHVVDIDGQDTIADLKKAVARYAEQNDMTFDFVRIHGGRAYVTFVRPVESLLLDPADRRP